MKKYFYLAAVSAMMLTACSSDKDVLQPTPEPTSQVTVQQQAVSFDTYLSGTTASTRAGEPEGVMTTDKLKTPNKGFGVFAFYHDNTTYAAEALATNIPDFMYNEQIHWSNGWTYSPLKYWPNETVNDSQDPAATIPYDRIDKLSFFAYAPYVSTGTSGDLSSSGTIGTAIPAWTGTTYGITGISDATVQGTPSVKWTLRYGTAGYENEILDHNVDLLWGVAPKGMNYQAVNGKTVETTFGLPIKDLVKPDKDMKVKFLFQHALSRIGLSVVSAIDQIAAGDDGGKFDKNQTRVLIENVTVWGDFGKDGVLKLENTTPNVANWDYSTVTKTNNAEANPILLVNTTNHYLSPDLRYPAVAYTFNTLEEGVLPNEKNLLASGVEDSYKLGTSITPAYKHGRPLYKANASGDYVLATATATLDAASDIFTKNDNGDFIKVASSASTFNGMDAITKYYTIVATAKNAATPADNLAAGDPYYTLDASSGDYKYNVAPVGGLTSGTYYTIAETQIPDTKVAAYASDTYWTRLSPRYFMVIPSELPYVEGSTETEISVKIKYHVITEDAKLSTGVSDVTNEITKTAKFQLESGKSYNLKLILGLTSVKLDAVVGEWQVGDDAEVWLPQNVE